MIGRVANYFCVRSIDQMVPCAMPKRLAFSGSDRVLVFAPHPDDETIGCGGTIALLREAGCDVHIVLLTDGGAGDPFKYAEDVVATRRAEFSAALSCLGGATYDLYNESDGSLSPVNVRKKIEATIKKFAPTIIFSPSLLDYHRDHVATALAVRQAWRQVGCGARLYCYEISAPQPATHIVDISAVIPAKRAALSEYRLPQKYADYLGSVDGLNRYRGLLLPKSSDGPVFGEAFFEDAGGWILATSLWRLRARIEKNAIGGASRVAM